MTDARKSKRKERPADETIKETIESIIIAFILAFVFRAYVVEAFIIPTGSMAPTLLGAHMPFVCDECGYEFKSDWPPFASANDELGQKVPAPLTRDTSWACPMCRYPNEAPAGARARSGDRILVHKYIYNFSEPRRWDVVVFKSPENPEINFIKRLVGLPDELLYILEGNIYVAPAGARTPIEPIFEIARKTNPDNPRVQRALWQPVYHSQYIPRDGGQRVGAFAWSLPWEADEPEDWDLHQTRSYTYSGRDSGTLRFDFAAAAGKPNPRFFAPALYPYNQLWPDFDWEPIEDVRIAATVVPRTASLGLSLSTTARLNNPRLDYGVERISADFSPDGDLVLRATDPVSGEERILRREHVAPFREGESREVELWYADQEATVWLDGRCVLRWDYGLPFSTLAERARNNRAPAFPDIQVTVQGGPATLHRVEVDRDLYYASLGGSDGGRTVAWGGYLREGSPPLHIGPDEFFTVGDNSPRSHDGRFWNTVNPWIAHRMLEDRRLRGEDPAGVVPRNLLMGRAFFVYFPAPYPSGLIPIPNFGDMRFIH